MRLTFMGTAGARFMVAKQRRQVDLSPGVMHDGARARVGAEARPRLAFLTHYGTTVWRADRGVIAADLAQRTGIEVRAATDGLSIEL